MFKEILENSFADIFQPFSKEELFANTPEEYKEVMKIVFEVGSFNPAATDFSENGIDIFVTPPTLETFSKLVQAFKEKGYSGESNTLVSGRTGEDIKALIYSFVYGGQPAEIIFVKAHGEVWISTGEFSGDWL